MKRMITPILFLFFIGTVFSQAPQAFKFQTIIRDASGEVIPLQDLTLKFLIHVDVPEGEVIYSEQHLVTTNASGLVSVDIGLGEVLSGSFTDIVWGDGEYFLEELIDIGNTGEFQVFGTVQLLSVPYALHANTAGNGIQSMTTEERDAIESPHVGMQIFNITTNCLNYFNGTDWFETCGECTPQPSVANAGQDTVINTEITTINLTAQLPESGTGEWNVISGEGGALFDSNDPQTEFTGLSCTDYELVWSVPPNVIRTRIQLELGFTPSQPRPMPAKTSP